MSQLVIGDNIEIKESYSWNTASSIQLWPCIADYGSAQVVYRIVDGSRDLVLKVLRDSHKNSFSFWWERKPFSEVDFYWNCLDGIKDSWVLLPDEYDVVDLYWEENNLAFIQSYLWNTNEFSEDERWIHLPDLWLISWNVATWTMRVSTFQEWFYFPNTGKHIFADWDKYLLDLKEIAEKTWVKTMEDLKKFRKEITKAL